MRITVEKLDQSQSGTHKCYFAGQRFTLGKKPPLMPVIGKDYDIEYEDKEYQGVKYKQITSIKEVDSNQPTQTETKLASNSDKNRAMALSYAKDLVVSGHIKIEEMYLKADEFIDYMEGKGAPVPF